MHFSCECNPASASDSKGYNNVDRCRNLFCYLSPFERMCGKHSAVAVANQTRLYNVMYALYQTPDILSQMHSTAQCALKHDDVFVCDGLCWDGHPTKRRYHKTTTFFNSGSPVFLFVAQRVFFVVVHNN